MSGIKYPLIKDPRQKLFDKHHFIMQKSKLLKEQISIMLSQEQKKVINKVIVVDFFRFMILHNNINLFFLVILMKRYIHGY